MLSTGTPSATVRINSVRIAPGSALNPHVLQLPRLGDVLDGDRVTLVLTGVDNSQNNAGGLRIALGSVTLDYQILALSSPWQNWQVARFGDDADDPAVAGPVADPDADGIPNLLEYALAGDPRAADPQVLPTIRAATEGIEIRFTRNPATDLMLDCQHALSPGGPWNEIARSSAGEALESLANGVEITEQEISGGLFEVCVHILAPPDSTGFYRLRAVLGGE